MSPKSKVQHITAPLDAVERGLGGGAISILRALRQTALEKSISVYLVGGPVRDVLMGMPVKDLDFTVEGDAPSLARQLAVDLGGRVVLHPAFGTATIEVADARVDLVTARREVYPSPAALPQVTAAAIADDLARRDFAINSLAVPLNDKQAQILDPHGGINDLRQSAVRILHPDSFVDDPTRVFRAIRYEQRLDFCIEDGTLSRMQAAIDGRLIGLLTGDRLRHELERIFEEERPGPALVRAEGLGVLAAIHPSLTQIQPVERLSLPAVGGLEPLSYLAALTYPLSSTDAEAVISRLNMPNSWAQIVRDTVSLKQREPQLAAGSLAYSQVARLVEDLADVAVLTVSQVTDSPPVAQRLTRYFNELRHLSPKLDGLDLLLLGVPEGPRVGRLLQDLRDAKLDGRLVAEEDERRFVKEYLARQGFRDQGFQGHG